MSDGPAPTPTSRRRLLPWLVGGLMVSLCLNLFLAGALVGGMAKGHAKPHRGMERAGIERMVPPPLREAVRDILKDDREAMRNLMRDARQARRDVMTTLRNPAATSDDVAAALDRADEATRAVQAKLRGAALQALAAMPQEKREALAATLHRHTPPPHDP